MIEKILAWLSGTISPMLAKVPLLNKLEPDKQLHVLAGTTAWLATMLATRSPLTAFVFTLLLASLKEWYDAMNPTLHTVDYKDVLATTVPAAVLSLAAWGVGLL